LTWPNMRRPKGCQGLKTARWDRRKAGAFVRRGTLLGKQSRINYWPAAIAQSELPNGKGPLRNPTYSRGGAQTVKDRAAPGARVIFQILATASRRAHEQHLSSFPAPSIP
jgi:hypothetical protein